MKKLVTSVVAAIALSATSALAADVPTKAKVVAPAPAPSPFDIAFGGSIMSDYNFRGVSQSNRGPSVNAYVEPQFNTGFGTLYVGLSGYSIEWPSGPGYFFSDPAAEIDIYGGWRNTWGAFTLDLIRLYPGVHRRCVGRLHAGRAELRSVWPGRYGGRLPFGYREVGSPLDRG
jgi:hypothetical protein